MQVKNVAIKNRKGKVLVNSLMTGVHYELQ
jgi:hypothetical protein